MSRIKVMSRALSNRIAAGEVIERPASVVKELVENSIDAGADFIEVEIERAGSRLIAVTDNGCGMDREDALLSLEQHGTSKLLSEDDLNAIMTLGFRGEALPSIASISNFKLITRTADAEEGVVITTDGSRQPTLAPCACASGTRIEVRDIFHNLPARKKFLKSPATEEHHIEEMISLLAIGHPEVGFRLNIDGRTAFHSTASGKLENRLRELFGRNFAGKMLSVEHCEGSLHISGYVAAPGFTRPSRKDQRVFINSRPVEAQAVYRGIKEGYATLAEPGRYNPTVLFIEMPPDELDVNVHPAKREVRFRSEYTVSRAVAAAVSAALRQLRSPEKAAGIASAPGRAADLPLSGKLPISLVLDAAEIRYEVPEKVQMEFAATPGIQTGEPVTEESAAGAVEPKSDFTVEPAAPVKDYEPAPADGSAAPDECEALLAKHGSWGCSPAFTGEWPQRIIGVLDNTYIVCANASGMVLVDQHAAHERVMFERLIKTAAAGEQVRQSLLFPETIELPRAMLPLLTDYQEVFEQLGFEVESAGSNAVIVSALPLSLGRSSDVEAVFTDMLEELLESSGSRLPVALEQIARAACKAAVKAHDELSRNEQEKLLDELRECRQGTLCPHGRPTMVSVGIKELEKRFGRR